jgi:serine/threonine protein kinase
MPQPAGIHAENVVGFGTSGMVALYPNTDTVIKFPHSAEGEDDILGTRPRCQREKEAYERLATPGRPTTILTYLGPSSDNRGILLEYAENGTIEEYLQKRKPPEEIVLRWSRQAAEALDFCHSKHVLHGDVRCGNLLLDRHLNVKLGDFTGSSIDKSEPLSYYDTDHLLPRDNFVISAETEIFAFGSTLFQMVSGIRPYHSLKGNEKEQKFRLQQFPDVTGYGFFGDIITKCWQLEYGTMADVLKSLDAAGVYFSVVADFKTANHLKNVPVADGQLSR